MTASDRHLGTGRRNFLKGAAAAALGIGGMVATGLPALAARQAGLPPAGAEFPLGLIADKSGLRIGSTDVRTDLRGEVAFRAETNAGGPADSVRLRMLGLRMSGELSGDGSRQDGGVILIEQEDADVAVQSLLKLTQPFPQRYEQTMVLSFTMKIVQPGARIDQPLVLTTKEPAVLVGQLTQFPPKGDFYQLQNPVDLVLPDDPDTTLATIHTFPVQVGSLG
ncbi:hypothetical protein [Amycolatopsis magusensis]|uniref:Tat (Twin-arginine translocation) pathway signal sequence n=1 Tax=Amycolatopsis magusensis TaxID=882444 RepID=A0ABS4PVP5_9PSEU|nr:hypothetical protein [Amycolatopsis magusensis]MBP2183497.1 hypothetical protein [Amycolatopsis magusensis]